MGISTDGRKMPHAIGIDPRRVLRNRTFGIPRLRASDCASASHGASTMSGVRRDIHWTAARPRNIRKRIMHAPTAQIVMKVAVQESVPKRMATAASHESCDEDF